MQESYIKPYTQWDCKHLSNIDKPLTEQQDKYNGYLQLHK